mmetsp:Transcript_15913/g.21974  ORF Transcript_15913/g.21974 Transcript_15913/m.21974 type:complete len:237 (-) Transcript_15913:101-811(-)
MTLKTWCLIFLLLGCAALGEELHRFKPNDHSQQAISLRLPPRRLLQFSSLQNWMMGGRTSPSDHAGGAVPAATEGTAVAATSGVVPAVATAADGTPAAVSTAGVLAPAVVAYVAPVGDGEAEVTPSGVVAQPTDPTVSAAPAVALPVGDILGGVKPVSMLPGGIDPTGAVANVSASKVGLGGTCDEKEAAAKACKPNMKKHERSKMCRVMGPEGLRDLAEKCNQGIAVYRAAGQQL